MIQSDFLFNMQALVNKAQELVQKARSTQAKKKQGKKSVKGKVAVKSAVSKPAKGGKRKPVKEGKSSTDTEAESGNLRRSSRHSAQVAAMAIHECLDVRVIYWHNVVEFRYLDF